MHSKHRQVLTLAARLTCATQLKRYFIRFGQTVFGHTRFTLVLPAETEYRILIQINVYNMYEYVCMPHTYIFVRIIYIYMNQATWI